MCVCVCVCLWRSTTHIGTVYRPSDKYVFFFKFYGFVVNFSWYVVSKPHPWLKLREWLSASELSKLKQWCEATTSTRISGKLNLANDLNARGRLVTPRYFHCCGPESSYRCLS